MLDDFLYMVGDLFRLAAIGLAAIVFVTLAIVFSPILIPLALLGRYVEYKEQHR